MAVASYVTDLTDISLAVGAWGELTGAIAGLASTIETDYFIEGTTCVSKPYNATGLGSMATDYGSSITIPSGAATFHWIYFGAPNAIATLGTGGYRIAIGSSMATYNMWYVLGSDTYTYGGWRNIAVDPTVATDSNYGGLPTTTRVFGSVVNNLLAIAKGNPYANDAIRYGRILQVTAGEAANYGTFLGAATQNDVSTKRWGLFQAIDGGYLQKGLFLLGTAATAVDFRDSNRNIFIQDTTKVTSGFNEFAVMNTGSRVDWTGIQITALGTTSKGKFTTTNNADINFDTCTFTDMDTFVFMSSATVLATTFRRCGQVTQGDAVFTNCKFDNSTASKAFIVDNIADVTNTEFISDGTGYAIEGFSSAGNYTLTNLTFTNYAAGNGTSGNEAIHVLATGGTANLSISGGNTPSIHTEGATVNFPSTVTLKMVVTTEAGNPIMGALAYIDDQNITPFILNATTNTDGEASVGYSGSAVTDSTWRVRKYGYKNFKQLIDIGSSNITLPVTLVVDPQQI